MTIPGLRSRQISEKYRKRQVRRRGAERAPDGSTRRSCRLQHVRGPPPARAQPSRSHLGTARRSQCRHPAPSLPARPEHAADTCARDSRAAVTAVREVGRGGLRRGDLARDARRRAEAVGGPCCACERACRPRDATVSGSSRAGWGGNGTSSSPCARGTPSETPWLWPHLHPTGGGGRGARPRRNDRPQPLPGCGGSRGQVSPRPANDRYTRWAEA